MSTPRQPNADADAIREAVRTHYASAAVQSSGSGCCGSSSSASSSSCCGSSAPATVDPTQFAGQLGYTNEQLRNLPAGANLGLSCGNPHAIASLQPGDVVLDLGSGAGFDCFLAAQTVGPRGKVIGVDMTPQMISKARSIARAAGISHVEFRLGEIEALPVADQSIDVIVSNCVLNLSPQKDVVINEAFRVLRPGGRLAVSDIVATGPIPSEARGNLAQFCGCVSGAASVDEWRQTLERAGFADVRITINEASREMAEAWASGWNAKNCLASALNEATRPR